ncbi:MAG: M12 family metallo-peptidase [Phycisphaerales bacterium]|nr:M12 family metallo-peptidase [Phycisphaerales bacterium]
MEISSVSLTTKAISGFLTLGLVASTYAATGLKPVQSNLNREINRVLNLEDSWHSTLKIDGTPGRPISISIPLDNMTYTMELEPYSVRADDYSVFMQDDSGELYEVEPLAVRTLRGSIVELGGSVVAATLMPDGLHARIRISSEQEYWMEPVGEKIEGIPSDMYAFYRGTDIIASGGTCAAEDHMDVDKILSMLANYDANQVNERGNIICTAQLGVDTDYEYYQDWGSNTETRINSVVNSVNLQYEDEVALSHEITTIIVRSSPNDPYTSSNAEILLDQFASEWQNNQGGIQRDLAHLFTGKNLQNGTIGIAWLGSVCSSVAYGLAESDCCGSFGCATDLSAHEMGHGWGAGHVNSPSYQTMYPSIQCANLFVQTSINEITSFSGSLSCLTCSNSSPTGACCVGTNCIEIYESNCNNGGGIWQGDWTTCADATCTIPVGACCVGGDCFEYEEADCNNAGGSYAGDETNCSTVGCTTGACCVGIDCSITLQDDCTGSWYGDNTTCADVSCGASADELNHILSVWSRSDGQAMETYDLFFPSTDPNTKMIAVFGDSTDMLQIRSWSNSLFDGSASLIALHQSEFGSDLPHDRQLDGPLGDDVKYDSYVTIGSDDAAIGTPMIIGFDSDGFNSSAGAAVDNGVWFVIPDDPLASMGAGTADGHRLISLSVEQNQGTEILANVQWYDGAGDVHETRGIYWNNQGLGGGVDCPTDIDGNGSTDVSDLLALIADWGPCSGCAGDLDGNGLVDVSDLLTAIGAWGPCE